MKKFLSLMVVMAMTFSLVACGSSSSDESEDASASVAEASSDEAYEIVVIPRNVATDNWQMMAEGAKAAGEEIGEDKVTITIDGLTDTTDFDGQVAMLENYIANGVDAISVAPLSDDSVINTMTDAKEDGIKIGFVDTAPDMDYDNFVVYDNIVVGEDAADAMVDAWDEKGIEYGEGSVVILISPVAGVSVLDDRESGFEDRLAELAPDVEVVEYYCDGDNNIALSNAQDAWQVYGDDIVGMIGLDEGVLDAISRCMDENNLKDKFVVVGVDVTATSVPDLQSGNVSALIGVGMYDMGYTSVMNLYSCLQGEEVEKETVISPVSVTIDNVNDEDIRWMWDASLLED